MLYLIFKGKKFKGFSGNKQDVKAFLESRKNQKFIIEKVSEEEFEELLTNIQDIHLYQLAFYPEYQHLLFGYEANQLFDILTDRFMAIHQLYLNLNRAFIYTKMSEEEYQTIRDFFHFIEMMSDDLMGADVYAPFKDYLDIDSIVNVLVASK